MFATGNYCLQTALGVADGAQVQELVAAILPHLATLRDNVRYDNASCWLFQQTLRTSQRFGLC